MLTGNHFFSDDSSSIVFKKNNLIISVTDCSGSMNHVLSKAAVTLQQKSLSKLCIKYKLIKLQ